MDVRLTCSNPNSSSAIINWDRYNGNGTRYRRDLGAYINERDTAHLYTKSIESADIRNEDEIPFQVFFLHLKQYANVLGCCKRPPGDWI